MKRSSADRYRNQEGPRHKLQQIIRLHLRRKKKLAKAEEVKSNNEKRAHLIKRIATLEKEMHDDEQQANKEATHPPAKKQIVLVVHSLGKCTNTHSNVRDIDV